MPKCISRQPDARRLIRLCLIKVLEPRRQHVATGPNKTRHVDSGTLVCPDLAMQTLVESVPEFLHM